MKKTLIVLALLSAMSVPLSVLRAQGELSDDDTRQYVSWGVVGGANVSSFIMKVDPLLRDTLIADSVLSSLPATGMSLTLFMDYHITPEWRMQFGGQFSLEQSMLRYADRHSHLLTLGTDVSLAALYRTPWRGGHFYVALGPYCHFVLYSTATDGTSLYRRQVYRDPVSGKSRFALNDIYAGIGLTLGYEFRRHWLVQMENRFGVTDILNLKTRGTYVYPYKITFGVGVQF